MTDPRRRRLEDTIAGRSPDRVPVSAWGHFFPQETSAQGLAEAMVGFFERYDWDYLKIHARASYHVEGWGFEYKPSVDPVRAHECTVVPISCVDDWRGLRPLPPTALALKEQVEAIRLIRRRIGEGVPLIMTVFSPLDIAEKLLDRNAALLKHHIETDADAVEQGLRAISETFARFLKILVAEGIDGIFFSTKWANNIKLNVEQYRRLVRPFDLMVLEAAKPLWCNILHLCEDDIQLAAMADYPVQVFHWDAYTGRNPAYGPGQETLSRTVGGGVDARTLAEAAPEQILARAQAAIARLHGRNLMLGPGCSVQIARTPSDNLQALRRAVELSG